MDGRDGFVGGRDRRAETAALETFLRTRPDGWHALAAPLLAQVGEERLRSIVEATTDRLRGVSGVGDGPDGLRVHGPGGHVLAWVHLDAQGALDGLMVSPRLRRGGLLGRLPPVAAGVAVRGSLLCALLALVTTLCWRASSVQDWAADLLDVTLVGVVVCGLSARKALPVALRGTVAALTVAAVASAVRVPGLAQDGDPVAPVGWALVLAVLVAATARGRRHRWGVAVGQPLSFPLRGDWYVVQGGGRLLNHHHAVAEQRGAVDLLRVGRWGTRPRGTRREDVTAYLAYGADVHAPCAGRVVSAAGDLEDQVPGRQRYGPPYGNHVVIDTGSELVRLAHLRPGSVTVRPGDVVTPGRPIGQVGNSGRSTEPHLHLQADRAGQGLDLEFDDLPGALFRGRRVRRRVRPCRTPRSGSGPGPGPARRAPS